jgi:transcriptional regulator with XRE-family HTH domain
LRDILAKNMRLIRATQQLSQEALAHECGLNRTYLSAIERSERNPAGIEPLVGERPLR